MFPNAKVTNLPDHLKWECLSIPQGEAVTGVLMGEVITVATHWINKRSFPCLTRISEGKLRCPCELQPMSLRTIGYAPIITKNRERFVAVLSGVAAAQVDAIRPGTVVTFFRPKKAKTRIQVSTEPDYSMGEDLVKRLRQAATHKVHEYLIHLWQCRDLSELFGLEFYQSHGSTIAEADRPRPEAA